ncbi:unnamed protein product [Moneuplotes crassus]|uniref:Uncharacterized protein n=2 Tax=Euplotes crassus TaxID=5936 RepID=A0AAD1Y4C2_EUPCR|nr:unnamed protein product [Moneuplotes crassus]
MGSSDQFRGSVKAFISIELILFVAYVGVYAFMMFKTKYFTQKVEIMPIMTHFIKALEFDLMPTLFILSFVIIFGAFYVFACLLGYLLLFAILPLFIIGRVKENDILIKVAKFSNIGIGLISFLVLFIDNLQFD